MLWIPITLGASAAQVVRNGAQASLTGKIGTLGATQVRFVFGFPFAVLFLLAGRELTGENLPHIGAEALRWGVLGAVGQIAATALMLAVMHRRAFGVAYAYIKTEPVIVAVLGALLLGDRLPPLGWVAVVVVTAGVLFASVKPGEFANLIHERGMIAMGVLAGGLFGLSAIAFRGAINSLAEGSFLIRSLTILVLTLGIQAGLLGLWLALRDRAAFFGSLREWRQSIGAGFLGALASACWFTAFSLTAAANVRTLGLAEMPLAALLSGKLTGKGMARHEVAGLAMVMAGVGLLLWSVAA
ncbi:MAG: EamA family transporter [Novosphingobium sp.]|nr:EamA family transporter [Novosphingobium sp.]